MQINFHWPRGVEIDEELKAAEKSAATAERLKSLGSGESKAGNGGEQVAKSLGEHVIKSIGETGFGRLKNMSNTVIAAPEYKASTDTQTTRGGSDDSPFAPWLTDVDRGIVREHRRRPVVADLLGTGQVAGSSIRYFVEGPFEGEFETVGETRQKPQMPGPACA